MSNSPADIRTHLIDAVRLDLVGQRPGHAPHAAYADEALPIAPSKWYLTGFLVPYEAPASQRTDDDGDEQIDQVGRIVDGDDESTPEQASARKAFFPSSMGLSVLVSADTAQLRARVAWGDYQPVSRAKPDPEEEALPGDVAPEQRAGGGRWRRVPREAECVLTLREGSPATFDLKDHPDLKLVVSVRAVGDAGLVPKGTRSVSVFLVNHRPPAPDVRRDAAYVFQPELSLHTLDPFVPRPDLHGQESDDWDEKVADLQYRDAVEYAVGHNISAPFIPDWRHPSWSASTTSPSVWRLRGLQWRWPWR